MILIDRSIPKSVASSLKLVRDDVLWLEDLFAHNTPDAVWLAQAGQMDHLVVTRDAKIRSRPAERQAIINSRVGAFVFTQKQVMRKWDYYKLFGLTLDEMVSRYAAAQRPFIVGVGRTGVFTRLL